MAAGGACALISFFVIMIADNSNHEKIGFFIALAVSLFGFISSLRAFEKDGKSLSKVFRIIEMIFCGFEIIFVAILCLFQ